MQFVKLQNDIHHVEIETNINKIRFVGPHIGVEIQYSFEVETTDEYMITIRKKKQIT